MIYRSKSLYGIFALIAALSVMALPVYSAPGSDDLLKAARDSAKLAQTLGVSQTDAVRYFDESIQKYKDIIKSQPGTPQAQQAQSELNDIYTAYVSFLKSEKTAAPAASTSAAKGKTPVGPAELLEAARSAANRTKQAGISSDDLNAAYKEAIDYYTKCAKETWTPEAASAMLEHSQLLATESKYKNLEMAHKTVKQLLLQYNIPVENIQSKIISERKLSAEQAMLDAQRILETVNQAKEYEPVVLNLWDKQNSKTPQYKIMDFLVALTGHKPGFSYWFAIIILTVIIKFAMTPLTKAQFKAMKEMQKVTPLIKEIQEKHKGDQKVIGEKTMAIYKEHGVNPFASCLPLFIQMPILMLLYYTIKSYEPQFVHGHFLWIGSAARHLYEIPVPKFFGTADKVFLPALNLAEPDLILVLLYLVSMYFSTKMSNVDPSQADQQKMMAIMMPIMFAFIFAGFPSAFLLYWLVFNVIQMVQQYLIMRDTGKEGGAGGAGKAKPLPTK